MSIPSHHFNIKLPLHPGSEEGSVVEMDGEKLFGVTNLFLKAGTNGFTNIAIEFQAPVAMEMVSAFLPAVEDPPEDLVEAIGQVYNRIAGGFIDQNLAEGESLSAAMAGELFKLILEAVLREVYNHGQPGTKAEAETVSPDA